MEENADYLTVSKVYGTGGRVHYVAEHRRYVPREDSWSIVWMGEPATRPKAQAEAKGRAFIEGLEYRP